MATPSNKTACECSSAAVPQNLNAPWRVKGWIFRTYRGTYYAQRGFGYTYYKARAHIYSKEDLSGRVTTGWGHKAEGRWIAVWERVA